MSQRLFLRSLLGALAALTSVCACGDDTASGDAGPDARTDSPSAMVDAATDSGGPGDSGLRGRDSGTPGPGGVLVGVPCDLADVADANTTLSTDPAGDQLWRGLIHITAPLAFGAGEFTIEPGTTFIMDADASLELGWNSSAATVMAMGTETLPIRFCGKVAEAGYWGGLRLGDKVTQNSVLEHVQIFDAGGTGFGLRLDSGVRVSNVLVERSSEDGVRAARFARNSEQLSVVGAGGAAVVLLAEVALNDFPLGGEFTDNADNSVRLRFSDIDVDVTIKDPGIPYVQEEEVWVKDVSVVFEPGVDYRFAADAFLEIGWNSNRAELLVEGESMNPVVFQGESPTKGFWRGIRVNTEVLSTSRIAYAEIRHAGGLDIPALRIRARITLDHVTVEDNLLGVVIDGPLQPASTNLTVTGTEGTAVTADPTALPTLPEGGSYVGNGDDEIEVDGTSSINIITGTIPDLGVPYHLLSDISLKDGSDVVIAPGTEFIMPGGALLEVGWNSGVATLIAAGTLSEPIVFVGEQNTAGYWKGFLVGSNASGNCELDHVVIANAGEAGDAAVRLRRAISITNTTIRDSVGDGIAKPAADTTNYTTSNTFTGIAGTNVVDN